MASQYSGNETRRRAKEVSALIGGNHTSIFIDKVTDAVKQVFSEMKLEADSAKSMKMKTPNMGASAVENLALQNIQARISCVETSAPHSQDGKSARQVHKFCLFCMTNLDS